MYDKDLCTVDSSMAAVLQLYTTCQQATTGRLCVHRAFMYPFDMWYPHTSPFPPYGYCHMPSKGLFLRWARLGLSLWRLRQVRQ